MKNKDKSKIIGQFTGMCADADVTNENGLDIPREVWETLFASELYKQGIELGWYIGYLGHPDDPGAMTFQDACIVMTEGHMDDDGKVYGTFDLVDTPVGRIVKTFIDAGTTFGISVRGAGDIIDNAVDPETFVFRGFDIVTFPAYREAIPEFKAIAASTDTEDQKKYKKVCSAVKRDLHNITSAQALEIIQEQIPEQSEVYKSIETRKCELLNDPQDEVRKISDICDMTIDDEKLDGIMALYLEEKDRADNAEAQLAQNEKLLESTKISMNRKIHTIARITAAQEKDVDMLHKEFVAENNSLKHKNKIASSATQRLKGQLHVEKQNNLRYQTKIEANEKVLAEKDITISNLQKELDETVVAANKADKKASNLGVQVNDLKKQITASRELISEYQDAYANLYAQALGVNLNVSVTASTTVADLQKKILGSSAHEVVSDELVEPQLVDLDDNFDDDSLVTL